MITASVFLMSPTQPGGHSLTSFSVVSPAEQRGTFLAELFVLLATNPHEKDPNQQYLYLKTF